MVACVICTSASLFAQTTAADKILLASFAKSIDQGRYQEVESQLLKFVVSKPEVAEGYELLARLRYGQQRLPEARSLYQRALSLDPKLTLAKIDLGITTFMIGETERAREDLRSVSLGPSEMSAYGLRLVEALVLVGEFDAAVRTIDSLPPIMRNGAALPFRAQAYLSLKRRADVLKLIPFAKAKIPRETEIAVDVASVLIGTEFNKEATILLTSSLASSPTNLRVLLLLGRAKVNERDFAAARIYAVKAQAISPESGEAAFLLATVESEQGNTSEAFAAFELAIALAPASIDIKPQAVIAAMRAKKPRRAVEIARELLAARPDDPEAIYLFGAASLQAGRIADAETFLGRFTRERPKDGRGCVAYSLALAAQPEKVGPARRKLEECVATDPRNFEATYQLALSHRSTGETAQAINYLERTVDLSPNYAFAVRDLGVLYLQAGKEEQARAKLETAAKLAPNDADTHFQLSRLYNLSGQPELAKQHFDMFQKLRNRDEK